MKIFIKFILILLFSTQLCFGAQESLSGKVGRDKLTFFDAHRRKQIEVQLWYPVDNNVKSTPSAGNFKHIAEEAWNAPVNSNIKLPLIVVSHGWNGNPEFFAWFADYLALNGFFVAIPQHTSDVTNPPSFNDWNRPLDISFTITKLLTSKYQNNIDANRIGFAGYSLGGGTGIWLAGGKAEYFEHAIFPGEKYINTKMFKRKTDEEIANTDLDQGKVSYYDPRIKAEFLMSPGNGWLFDEKSLSKIHIPIYIIEVTNDTILIPETNAFFYAKTIDTSLLKMIPGKADHFVFRAEIYKDKIKEYDPDGKLAFNYTDDPSVNRANIHAAVAKDAIQFFQSKLNYTQEQKNIDLVTNAYIELDKKNNPDAMEKFFAKDYQLIRNNMVPQTYQQLHDELVQRKKIIRNVIATPFLDIVSSGNKVIVRYNYVINKLNGDSVNGAALAMFELNNDQIEKGWLMDTNSKLN